MTLSFVSPLSSSIKITDESNDYDNTKGEEVGYGTNVIKSKVGFCKSDLRKRSTTCDETGSGPCPVIGDQNELFVKKKLN